MDYQFKIVTPSGELRRLRFKHEPAWVEFLETLKAFLSGRSLEDFDIQYRDEEGDQIVVNSQPEWSEALDILVNEKIKRFSIAPKPQRSKHSTSSSSSDPNRNNIEATIRQVLDQLLISADAVVNQIPDLVETFVEEVKKYQPAPVPEHPADQPPPEDEEESKPEEPLRFTPNVHSSFLGELRGPPCNFSQRPFARGPCFKRAYPRNCEYSRLHDLGIRLLEEKNFSGAVECFRELVQLYPGNSIARYNLACSFSMLSTIRQDDGGFLEKENAQQCAFEALRQAIDIGYSNLNHMENDEDLEPIRQRPEYKQIIAQLKGVEQPEQAPSELDPEFVIEPTIQTVEPIQAAQVEEITIIEAQLEQFEPEPEQLEPEQPEPEQPEPEQPEPEQPEPEQPEPEQLSNSQLDPAVRYSEELKQLSDMGFFDSKRNLELLERTEGDIFRVIAQLLD